MKKLPQTVHVWLEDEDRSGSAYTDAVGIDAVEDDLIVTEGDNLRLRADVSKIAMIYCVVGFDDDGSSLAHPFIHAYITSPKIAGYPIRITKGVQIANKQAVVMDMRDNPYDQIRAGDNVAAYGVEADEAGKAHYFGVAIIVSNAPIPKVNREPITHIARATATATTAGSWTQLTLTLLESLEKGDYLMYGARVQHSNAFAARFVVKGVELRPAVIPVVSVSEKVHPFSEFWGKGVPFHMPDGLPDIEILETAGSGTIQVEMYLRKVD